ncbi:MAG: HEPN domain-containing protein [Desulfurococcales archaeon]|nr:HEPN domain-containing protein [Desulfurococcales archaeon]
MFDCDEAKRWQLQSSYTLKSTRVDIDNGFYSWACFKAHQAAEYALKSILRGAGIESFGHDLMFLWRRAQAICSALEDLHECVTLLNKMYIPPRYPDAWAGGAVPYENYTRRDALESIECAEKILKSVEVCIHEVCEDT